MVGLASQQEADKTDNIRLSFSRVCHLPGIKNTRLPLLENQLQTVTHQFYNKFKFCHEKLEQLKLDVPEKRNI